MREGGIERIMGKRKEIRKGNQRGNTTRDKIGHFNIKRPKTESLTHMCEALGSIPALHIEEAIKKNMFSPKILLFFLIFPFLLRCHNVNIVSYTFHAYIVPTTHPSPECLLPFTSVPWAPPTDLPFLCKLSFIGKLQF